MQSQSSMLDLDLASALLDSIKDEVVLVLVGDESQLQPVEKGAPFRDLIASKLVPVERLVENHRQSDEGKGIVFAARNVIDGKLFQNGSGIQIWEYHPSKTPGLKPTKTPGYDTVTSLVTGLSSNDFKKYQIITATKVDSEKLNVLVQSIVNKSGESRLVKGCKYTIGDPVIQTRNDYRRDVMNGEIGTVCAFARTKQIVSTGEMLSDEIHCQFDNRTIAYNEVDVSHLKLAYACTGHKMQGSQSETVIVYISEKSRRVANRKWLYTAITRAEKQCHVVCLDERSLLRTIETSGTDRKTILPFLLGKQIELEPPQIDLSRSDLPTILAAAITGVSSDTFRFRARRLGIEPTKTENYMIKIGSNNVRCERLLWGQTEIKAIGQTSVPWDDLRAMLLDPRSDPISK